MSAGVEGDFDSGLLPIRIRVVVVVAGPIETEEGIASAGAIASSIDREHGLAVFTVVKGSIYEEAVAEATEVMPSELEVVIATATLTGTETTGGRRNNRVRAHSCACGDNRLYPGRGKRA